MQPTHPPPALPLPLPLHSPETQENTGPFSLYKEILSCGTPFAHEKERVVPSTPVLTLLLDQNLGEKPPVLSEVVNPGIKCRSMDAKMQLTIF